MIRLEGGISGALYPQLGDLGQLLSLLGLNLPNCEFGTILPACERENRKVFALVHFYVFALQTFIQYDCLLGPVLSPGRYSGPWPSRHVLARALMKAMYGYAHSGVSLPGFSSSSASS